MALSDSMFLFEIIVEDFKKFMRCKEFTIRSEFADVFTLNLSERNEGCWQAGRKMIKPKRKLRNTKSNIKSSLRTQVQSGHSLLPANNIEWLITHMSLYPLEISLWSKKKPEKKLGGAIIPWSKPYKSYLNKLSTNPDSPPVIVNGRYNIINESISKCMASITLSVKLRHIQGSHITALSNKKQLNEMMSIHNKTSHKNDTPISHSLPFAPVNDTKTDFGDNHIQLNELNKNKSLLRVVESDTKLREHIRETILRSRSLSSMYVKSKPNPLTYIFGCPRGQYGNRVYCVSYFTVENEVSGTAEVPKESVVPNASEFPKQSEEEDEKSKNKFYLKISKSQCPMARGGTGPCSPSVCSIDLPEEARKFVKITKCEQLDCNSKKQREAQPRPEAGIILDLKNVQGKCCDFTEKIEQVVGEVTGNVQIGDDPCYCTCECTFGFVKKTTYCTVCGGYEKVGNEYVPNADNQATFPCPVFHKLIDKSKLKNWSTSGSDSKKRDDQSLKSMKVGSGQRAGATARRQTITKSVESEKDTKKGIKKKKDDRFKFNYGYKGIPPQIGHSECAMPCTGTLSNVPKNMGWLWTAEDVPGMKFRPMWKPGATNKHVVRLLRMAKNPGEVITKKRRKDASKKRPLKRPLLIVHKKDGEYSVTMETMKTYSKPRALNQQPYEDKPVLTYTIGRTDEENRDRQKKKEREQRRLERQQRKFIQSAFQDMCQEICLKTYQQALGILPGAEDPECPCFTATSDKVNMDVSCSCSEENSTIGSDTDSDEWIVEFTPPVALFDPTFKPKKIFKADMGTQYTYLDYRVKLVDRFGNPVPRYFKGPDGRQQCSDLGGFWDPSHKWLEINVDGYIAPDGRWAPNFFTGPNGEQVEAESGKFQAANGKWFIVGIDGYVDCVGKWRAYPRPRVMTTNVPVVKSKKNVGTGDKKEQKAAVRPSEASWSCFGDVSPKHLSQMGIIGHGHDKKLLLSTLRDMLAHGEDVKIPQPSTVYRLPETKKSKRVRISPNKGYLEDRYKCHHPTPSEKGIIARDEHGNKTYFKLKDAKNKRPKERLANLASQGISVSSFHLPCFHSFINSEILKRQMREKIITLAGKSVATQV